MKILHTGDLHFRSGSTLSEIRKCSNFLIETASHENPDLNVIAGDLFDENVQLGSEAAITAIKFVTGLSQTAPTILLKGTPSHDGDNLRMIKELKNERIFIADRIGQIGFDSTGFTDQKSGDCLISCVPAPTKASVLEAKGNGTISENHFDIADLLRDVFQMWGQKVGSKLHIIVGHFTIRGSETSTGQQMVGKDVDLGTGDLAIAKPTLVLLGHIHKAQSWGMIYYCGSITRLNFGEEEDKGFFIHEILRNEEGSRIQSRFIKTPARVMVTQNWPDVSLKNLVEGDNLRVIVRLNEGETFDPRELKELAQEKGISLKLEKQIIPAIRARAEGISKVASLKEKLEVWLNLTGTKADNTVFEKLSLLQEESEVENIITQYAKKDEILRKKEGEHESHISETNRI
jgi:DNA repair protein SbcD/Mre11